MRPRPRCYLFPSSLLFSLSLSLFRCNGNACRLAGFVARILLYFIPAIARAYQRDERFFQAEKLSHFVYPSRVRPRTAVSSYVIS